LLMSSYGGVFSVQPDFSTAFSTLLWWLVNPVAPALIFSLRVRTGVESQPPCHTSNVSSYYARFGFFFSFLFVFYFTSFALPFCWISSFLFNLSNR
jgi:hypothetical protein